jgi:hypothetical protein
MDPRNSQTRSLKLEGKNTNISSSLCLLKNTVFFGSLCKENLQKNMHVSSSYPNMVTKVRQSKSLAKDQQVFLLACRTQLAIPYTAEHLYITISKPRI